MGDRYWTIKENMGYAGTDSKEEVDLCHLWDITEDNLKELSNEEIQEALYDQAFEIATEKISISIKHKED